MALRREAPEACYFLLFVIWGSPAWEEKVCVFEAENIQHTWLQ